NNYCDSTGFDPTINFTPSVGLSPPAITSALTASGTVGQAFSYQIAATNSPTSFGATGLPTGLGVNTTNGVISGTSSAAGTTNVTISATNAAGTGSATLALTFFQSASKTVTFGAIRWDGWTGAMTYPYCTGTVSDPCYEGWNNAQYLM